MDWKLIAPWEINENIRCDILGAIPDSSSQHPLTSLMQFNLNPSAFFLITPINSCKLSGTLSAFRYFALSPVYTLATYSLITLTMSRMLVLNFRSYFYSESSPREES